MKKIINVQKLTKSYGNLKAVNEIDFFVEEGSLFSFLGTNGAGKSTTIEILLTLLKPDCGVVTIDGFQLGKDDHQIRGLIGVVFQESILDALLSVKENLQIRGALYGFNKMQLDQAIERVADITNCHSFLHRPYGKLSGGQKRRADIARALLHNPKILVLDEPTTGLDPHSRKHIWEMIRTLQKENQMTIFLTTHYIEEAANSDYVVVMKNGSIIAKGTPEQLKQQYSSDLLIIIPTEQQSFIQQLQTLSVPYSLQKTSVVIPLPSTIEAIPIITSFQSYIQSFEVKQSSLDDVFIQINSEEVISDDIVSTT